MYVNELTLEYGDRSRAAVQELFDEALEKRLIPKPVVVEFSSWNRREGSWLTAAAATAEASGCP